MYQAKNLTGDYICVINDTLESNNYIGKQY